jgi:hypothetical protein
MTRWWSEDLGMHQRKEEKIVALEAKLDSTVKTLNKKVSFELGKKKGDNKSNDKVQEENRQVGRSSQDLVETQDGREEEGHVQGS